MKSWSRESGMWKDDSLAMKKRETKHMRREGKTREQHTWSRESGMWKDEEKSFHVVCSRYNTWSVTCRWKVSSTHKNEKTDEKQHLNTPPVSEKSFHTKWRKIRSVLSIWDGKDEELAPPSSNTCHPAKSAHPALKTSSSSSYTQLTQLLYPAHPALIPSSPSSYIQLIQLIQLQYPAHPAPIPSSSSSYIQLIHLLNRPHIPQALTLS